MKRLTGLMIVSLLSMGIARHSWAGGAELVASLTANDGKWSYDSSAGTRYAADRKVYVFQTVPDNPKRFMITFKADDGPSTFVGECEDEAKRCSYDTLDHSGVITWALRIPKSMYLHFMGDDTILWSSEKDSTKPGTLLERGTDGKAKISSKLPKNVSEMPEVLRTVEGLVNQ